jgi:hypothetical protein
MRLSLEISSVRLNGRDVPIDSYEDLKRIHEVIGACLEWGSLSSVQTTRPHQSAEDRPVIPPPGERIMDYALKAASHVKNPFAIRRLAAKMIDIGWQTRADSERKRVNIVRSTIKEHPDFLNNQNGTWSFKPKPLPQVAVVSPPVARQVPVRAAAPSPFDDENDPFEDE